jgi:hypothetical protein
MSRAKRSDNLIQTDGEHGRDDALYETLKRLGYAPKRAEYMAYGSPYGNNRKAMKRWLMEQKKKSGENSHDTN